MLPHDLKLMITTVCGRIRFSGYRNSLPSTHMYELMCKSLNKSQLITRGIDPVLLCLELYRWVTLRVCSWLSWTHSAITVWRYTTTTHKLFYLNSSNKKYLYGMPRKQMFVHHTNTLHKGGAQTWSISYCFSSSLVVTSHTPVQQSIQVMKVVCCCCYTQLLLSLRASFQ